MGATTPWRLEKVPGKRSSCRPSPAGKEEEETQTVTMAMALRKNTEEGKRIWKRRAPKKGKAIRRLPSIETRMLWP